MTRQGKAWGVGAAWLVTAIFGASFSMPLAAAPIIVEVSESAGPGEPVVVQGEWSAAEPQLQLAVVDSGGTPQAAVSMNIVNSRPGPGAVATARIPADIAVGLYEVRASDAGGLGAPAYVNRARANHVEHLELDPGRVFRLFGRNLYLPPAQPSVHFLDLDAPANPPLAASVLTTGSDAYVLRVQAPAGIIPGHQYEIRLSNGLGGSIGVNTAEETVMAIAGGGDPFGLDVPWAAEFAAIATRVFNAKTQFGAKGNGVSNDAGAIQNAINAAAAAGGGIVELPEGVYPISVFGGLRMKSGVVLRGAGYSLDENPLPDSSARQYRTVLTANGSSLYPAINMSSTQLAGIADLELRTIGLPKYQIEASNGSKQFAVRFRSDANGGGGVRFGLSRHVLIADAEIYNRDNRNVILSPLKLDAASDYFVRDTHLRYVDGRIVLGDTGSETSGSVRAVVERNRITRDYDGYLDNKEFGGFDFSSTTRMAILDNVFDIRGIPRTITVTNDGETILSQVGSMRGAAGKATGGGASTLIDATRSFSAFPQRYQLVLTNGRGAGQVRKIMAATGSTLTVDQPWTVAPDASTRYAVLNWSAERCLIKGNSLGDDEHGGAPRGIWLWESAFDTAVVGNTLVDNEGIVVRARQTEQTIRSYGQQRRILIADNYLKSTRPERTENRATVGVYYNLSGTTPLRAGGIGGVELRRNTVINTLPLNEFANGALPLMAYAAHITTGGAALPEGIPAIVGTLFADNIAVGGDYAYVTMGDTAATTIWNPQTEDLADLLRDDPIATFAGAEGQVLRHGDGSPAAPGAVAARVIAPGVHRVSWDDHADDEDEFLVEWSADGLSFAPVGVVPADTRSFVHTGAPASATHHYRVSARNAHGANVASRTGSTPAQSGSGLYATYFARPDFSGHSIVRIDQNVSGNWDAALRPAPEISGAAFSALWTGQVISSAAGNYTFTVATDDGVRLWVGGKLLIDRWNGQAKTVSGSVALAAGSAYDLRLEYYDDATDRTANIELRWAGPGFSQQLLPATALIPASLATTAPAAPTQLTVVPQLFGQVQVLWQDNASNETGYAVERRPDAGGDYVPYRLTGADTTAISVGELDANRYQYRVRAFNAAGDSVYAQ